MIHHLSSSPHPPTPPSRNTSPLTKKKSCKGKEKEGQKEKCVFYLQPIEQERKENIKQQSRLFRPSYDLFMLCGRTEWFQHIIKSCQIVHGTRFCHIVQKVLHFSPFSPFPACLPFFPQLSSWALI